MVKRSVNWLSQQRVDVPDMRAIESAARNDFDELLASFVTGPNNGYVMRGFEISMAGAIGGASSGLQLLVDPGAIFHGASSQSGTFYLVPTGTLPQQLNSATNTIVDGAFSPSAINYVSLEYERYIDDTTSSQVYLWNPTTNNETTKNAPRAQILRYRIRITTATPASNYLPIAAVTTDSGNNVIRIDDARPLMFSQGTGGFNPDPFNKYTYPEGREPNPSFSTSNTVNPFYGGDKAIGTLKEFMTAVTSEIQAIKGTTYWTSLSSSGSLESLRTDLGNTIITGRGTITHDGAMSTPGLMNWSDDIFIKVIGSRVAYKLTANPSSTNIVLADNQVAYITLVRGQTITPNLVFTNSSKIVSSVGAISWTGALQSGDFIKLGSDTDAFYYEIDTVDSLTQVTLKTNYLGASTGPSGAKAKYSFGSYSSAITPLTSRDIFVADRENVPSGENIFWLMSRQDNAGAVARVYVRFLGMEIQEGESEEISDNVPLNVLQYIGSPIESATRPQYDSALNPGSVPFIEDLTFGDASQIAQNDYFLTKSSGNARSYYVWFNKDAGGTDPEATGTPIEVAITTGMTNVQVAQQVAQAMSATFYDDFTAVQRATPNDMIVRVTRNSAGATVSSSDFNIGAPFAVTTIQAGTGTGNYIVQDGDNLTLAIKKLDGSIGSIFAALDSPNYDESIDIVASGETPPTSLDGPIASSTLITLPDNTRLGNIAQKYTVGKGTLQVFLNGQYLRLGIDWAESGISGAASDQFQILRQLEVGDVIELRLSGAGGGAGGGGGGQGPQGPVGPAGPPGQDALGGPVSVNTYIADYTVMLSNKVLKGDCAVNSADITFTLPPAATSIGYVFYFKKVDATAFVVYVKGNAAELIDGLNIQPITAQWDSFMLVSDGSVWSIH